MRIMRGITPSIIKIRRIWDFGKTMPINAAEFRPIKSVHKKLLKKILYALHKIVMHHTTIKALL